MKKTAEIDGYNWQACYPFCAGCEELIMSGGCGFAGNGCKYPEHRILKPVNDCAAFIALSKCTGLKLEKVCSLLGDCRQGTPNGENKHKLFQFTPTK